jgi:hypothetical protein
MAASSFEYRFRFLIHGLLFAIAFAVPDTTRIVNSF